MLTIWGRPNSINVQKVLWCAEELGLSARRIEAGGEYGALNEPNYIAMNPNRLVPTLDDGGFVLWESNVIVRYLAHKYGSGTLCPIGAVSRFDGERWMDWQATTLWPALRPVFIGLIRTPPEKRDPEVQAEAEARCAEKIAVLDALLSKRPFVGGDNFTMADIPVGATAYRWYALDIQHPKLTNLERWYSGLTERAAFRKEVMLPLS
jgi:glutathione S-transferase